MARRVTAAALLGALCFAALGIALMSRDAAWAAGTGRRRLPVGLTVYLGVVPAEIVKGPPTRVLLSKGPHEYQISSKSPMTIKSLRQSLMRRVVNVFPTSS